MNFRKDVENLTEAYKQVNEVSAYGGPTIGSSVPPRPKFQPRPQVSGAVNWSAASDAAKAKREQEMAAQKAAQEAQKAQKAYDMKINSLVDVHASRPDMKGLTRAQVEADLRSKYPDIKSITGLETLMNRSGDRAQRQDTGSIAMLQSKQDAEAADKAKAQQELKDLGYSTPSSPTTTPNALDSVKKFASENPGTAALATAAGTLAAAKLLSRDKKDKDDK